MRSAPNWSNVSNTSIHVLTDFRTSINYQWSFRIESFAWQRLTGLRCLPTDTVMTPKKDAGGCWLELLGRSVAVTQSDKMLQSMQKHQEDKLRIDPWPRDAMYHHETAQAKQL